MVKVLQMHPQCIGHANVSTTAQVNVGTQLAKLAPMDEHCEIVDGPSIEGNAVVLRLIVRDPEVLAGGPVFVCKLKSFTDIAVELFPEGQTPPAEADLRADAAKAAKKYMEENVGEIENLFGELERRQAIG
jgi:hypothetical protein